MILLAMLSTAMVREFERADFDTVIRWHQIGHSTVLDKTPGPPPLLPVFLIVHPNSDSAAFSDQGETGYVCVTIADKDNLIKRDL